MVLSYPKLFVPNLHFYAYPVMDYMCYFLKEAKAMVWAHLPRVMKLIFRYLFFDEFACFFVYPYNIFFGSVWDHKNKHYLSKKCINKKISSPEVEKKTKIIPKLAVYLSTLDVVFHQIEIVLKDSTAFVYVMKSEKSSH